MRVLAVLATLLLCVSGHANTVSIGDTVVILVDVQEAAVPESHAPVVGHLNPGEIAECLGEVSGYHETELQIGTTGFVHKAWTHRVAKSASNIKIATFNIQTFGKTKAGNTDIMAELASIVRKYDIVATQEFKNKGRQCADKILDGNQ